MSRAPAKAKKKAAPPRAARRTPAVRQASVGVVYMVPRREAGEIVDPYQAQRIGAVWRCVSYLSGLVAQLPWQVWRPRASGGNEIDETSPVGWLLNRRPNPETSAFKFRETLMRHALLRGNGYAEIERTFDRRPLWLWQIHSDRVEPVRLASGALAYRVANPGGDDVVIPAADMFHVAGPSEDGVTGLPVIMHAALSVGMSAATERYGATFFSNSGMPSGVLKHPKTLTDPVSARVEDSWRRLQGGRRSQGTVVLEEGMEFQAISLPNDQAQFLESRKASVEEICRWFGVPLQKVMATMQATYRNMEQFNREVVQDTGIPWIRNFEQEADFKLLSDNRAGVFSMMDARQYMRGDSVERSTYYKNLFTAGAVSVNEIRDAEGLPPVEGGDSRYLQVNMGRLDDEGSVETPTPAATPAAPGDGQAEGEPPADGQAGDEPTPANDATAARTNGHANGHANGHDRDEQAIIAAIIPEVQRIKQGARGPRGQRGPRGTAPVKLVRLADGRIRIEMSDGTVLEESTDG